MANLRNAFGVTIIAFQEIIKKSMSIFRWTYEKNGVATILEIAVAKDDLGRVIGKQGKVINALRDLVRSSLNKNDKKVVIEVLS